MEEDKSDCSRRTSEISGLFDKDGTGGLANFIKSMMMEKKERKDTNPDNPIPILPSLEVIALVFSFYGYKGEEQNVF